MKIIGLSLFVILFFAISGLTQGQNLKENELVVIQGEKFILHQVRTGETVYSISKGFKVDSSELLKNNPGISQGLNIGDILKIPFNEDVELSEIPKYQKGDPTGFLNHTIKSRKETAYSISQMYGITVEEIYAYNPSVRKLKKGVTLKIPQWKYELKPDKDESTPVSDKEKQNDMIEHTVISGETLFSIGRKYQISESEILLYNPNAKNLKAGSKLYLPNKTAETKPEGSGRDEIILHTVVSGETLYGITKKYNVSEEELIALNPELKTAFRAGTQIRIPVRGNITDEARLIDESETFINLNNIPEGCRPTYRTGMYDTVNVALFLPLFLDANENLNKDFIFEESDSLSQIEIDTFEIIEEIAVDTTIEEEKPMQLFKQFYGNSENFLQFYEGVLVAVDSMQKAGMRIKLSVFDTKDNPESIRSAINAEAFKATDLILGPVYENVQKEVARVASIYQIPMISPFTSKSNIINNYQQFYQINPDREYIIEATAALIAPNDTNTNFIVLQTSPYGGTPEGKLVELIQRKFAMSDNTSKGKFTVYDFRTKRAEGFPEILLPDKENVVIIPSSDEGELSVAISNLNNFVSDTTSITLVGSTNYQQKYPSIEVAHFHNLKLKYINPYWVDYKDSSTIAYYQKFISNFGTEPNNYGVQGFDAAYYFLNAIYYFGKDFENCLPYLNVDLLQGSFYFKRVSNWGGSMNEGVSVISYKRNFEVKREGVIGKPKFERGL